MCRTDAPRQARRNWRRPHQLVPESEEAALRPGRPWGKLPFQIRTVGRSTVPRWGGHWPAMGAGLCRRALSLAARSSVNPSIDATNDARQQRGGQDRLWKTVLIEGSPSHASRLFGDTVRAAERQRPAPAEWWRSRRSRATPHGLRREHDLSIPSLRLPHLLPHPADRAIGDAQCARGWSLGRRNSA